MTSILKVVGIKHFFNNSNFFNNDDNLQLCKDIDGLYKYLNG